MASEVVRCGVLGPVGWAGLVALFDDLDRVDGFGGVGELLEPLSAVRVADCFCPFAEVAFYEFLHLLFQVGVYAEFVVQDDFSEVVYSSWEVLEPSGCSLEFVCCADVED